VAGAGRVVFVTLSDMTGRRLPNKQRRPATPSYVGPELLLRNFVRLETLDKSRGSYPRDLLERVKRSKESSAVVAVPHAAPSLDGKAPR
jgi:hypothetical protein